MKTPSVLTPPTQLTDMDLIHPPLMSNISSLALLPMLGNTFLVFLTVLWATQDARAAGTHRIRVQGTQETDAFSLDWCRHRVTFAPWGFVDFTFSIHQLF